MYTMWFKIGRFWETVSVNMKIKIFMSTSPSFQTNTI